MRLGLGRVILRQGTDTADYENEGGIYKRRVVMQTHQRRSTSSNALKVPFSFFFFLKRHLTTTDSHKYIIIGCHR